MTVLQRHGSSNDYVAKNIYDVAGNVWEWTMEASDPKIRFFRGGGYGDDNANVAASCRFPNNPVTIWHSIGFRVALYIK